MRNSALLTLRTYEHLTQLKHRKERFSSLIREELAKIIAKEIFFEGALITLTEVEVADDLKSADVYFSTIPSSKKEDALKLLNNSRNFLQGILMKKIKQVLPLIRFKIDEGIEKAAKLEKMLLDDKIESSD